MEPLVAISWDAAVFLVFLIVFTLAVAYTVVQRRGSGISRTPARKSAGPGDPVSDAREAHDAGAEEAADAGVPGEGDPQHGAR